MRTITDLLGNDWQIESEKTMLLYDMLVLIILIILYFFMVHEVKLNLF